VLLLRVVQELELAFAVLGKPLLADCRVPGCSHQATLAMQSIRESRIDLFFGSSLAMQSIRESRIDLFFSSSLEMFTIQGDTLTKFNALV